jgi:hypothetical protein
MRGHRSDADGVAVRGRGGNGLGTDRTTGTGLVVDDHGLVQRARHLLRQDASHGIGRSTRREWHDQLDRPVREVAALSHRGQCRYAQGDGERAPRLGFHLPIRVRLGCRAAGEGETRSAGEIAHPWAECVKRR